MGIVLLGMTGGLALLGMTGGGAKVKDIEQQIINSKKQTNPDDQNSEIPLPAFSACN
ncbi:MAG: hypothetical protein U5L07_11150 [Desulfobacterales bacterium]|nr:hypothetical protein [Desulfobacterales bacterium]